MKGASTYRIAFNGFSIPPSGNRLSKAVFTGPQFDPIYTDYYIRDAQGNVLATYRRHFDLDLYQSHYTVAERAIYGSDRMGVYAYNDTVYPIPPNWTDDFRPIHTGHKKYELKNHLGNVMAVVHGRKQAVQGSYGVISHYTAIPAFSGDYSAFGVRLRGRGDGDYRYGFQDQEHDTETFGGGSVNYKYRMHRPDLGRFFGVDPLHRDYPWNSGYAFQENKMGLGVELEGLELASLKILWANREAVKLQVSDAIDITSRKVGSIGSNLAEGIETADAKVNGFLERNLKAVMIPDHELNGVEGAKKVAGFENKLGTWLMATPLAPLGTALKGKAALMETLIDIEDENTSGLEATINAGVRTTNFFGGKVASGVLKKEVKKGLFESGRKEAAERAVDFGVNAMGDELEQDILNKVDEAFNQDNQNKKSN